MTIRNGMMAALCAGVLVLTLGCGGGGDDGAQRDLQAQVDMLMDERDAALQAEVAAEAAKAAAEAAQATAEMERDDANVAKGAAEELMRVAQQAQEDAETARQAAEAAETAAETAQQEAETARDVVLRAKTRAENDLAAANASKTMTEGDLAMVRQQLADANTALDTANDNLDTAKDDLATARKEREAAKDAEQQAKIDLARVEGELTALQRQLDQAERDTERAEDRAREAEQETQRVTHQVDADARARGLLTALEAVLEGSTWKTPGNTASAGINDRDTDIELTASPLSGSTRKSGDFYRATLTRTAPGVNPPERKAVAYTDREKSRTFANHYASSINATVGGTTSNPRFVHSTWATNNLNLLSDASMMWISNASRGGHPPKIGETDEDPDDELVSSLSARVHGVSGNYGCYISDSGQACRINVAAVYNDSDDDDRQELESLTITPEENSGGMLYFDPGSGTISLLNVPKPGAPRTTDGEFITFGWWQERPAMSDGTYQAAVFADVSIVNGSPQTYAVSDGTGSAEYEGPAVGLYVDRTSEGGTTIYESGDFTATVILHATFGTGDGAGVKGDVTDFRSTQHGSKDNWHVKLDSNADQSAIIVQSGTSSTGTLDYDFLNRHDNIAATVDDQPIAVTGRFDASIPNVRHIVGAFGAHRTTDPVPSQ